MKREEAIKIIRKMLACTDLTVRANLNADMVDACHLAIKALEQEPILDNIRAEIKALTSNRGFLSCSVDYIHKKIDAVFDKYKAEIEG